MATPLRTIGFYALAGQETSHRTLEGLLRYCDEMGGFAVRDFRVQDTVEDLQNVPPPWRGYADGMMINVGRLVERSDREMADWVLSGGVPVVSVAADWLDSRIPCFRVDTASLAQVAAEHLAQCGCASYLFFGFQGSTGSVRRGDALREVLAQRGQKLVSYSTKFRHVGVLENEAVARGEKELAGLLRKMRQPIGVWALNDEFAWAVCVLCSSLGLSIPEQVKVLGVDDCEIARLHQPTLSSIRTPGERIGYLAMNALHKQLDGKRGVRNMNQVMATELVARTSTVGVQLANGDFAAAAEYIARHACTNLTVEQVANAMGMSRSSLEKRFQQFLGHSPGQEIQRVRLEKAKDLLTKTRLSVSRIASMVGFDYLAAFSRFFTKHTGQSPMAYRQKQD